MVCEDKLPNTTMFFPQDYLRFCSDQKRYDSGRIQGTLKSKTVVKEIQKKNARQLQLDPAVGGLRKPKENRSTGFHRENMNKEKQG